MKSNKIFLFVFFVSICSIVFAETKTDRTFFMPRPVGTNLAMQMTSWFPFLNQDKSGTFESNFQIVPFYQASTNGSDLAKYFMFDNKTTLKISTAADADINPGNFNLSTNYDGEISFDPEQSVWGARMDFYQDLSKILKGLYYSASMPVVKIENDPGFKENITADGGWFNTAKTVLAGGRLSSEWSQVFRYGKIEGKKSVTGLADTDMKLGYRIFNQKRVKLGVNVALTVPTGNKSTGIYMWEPIMGNGRHWALGLGLDSDFVLWKNEDYSKQFSLMIFADYRYLFENRQFRTLELKDKHWGRFIRMRQQDPDNANNVLGNYIPGINVLTRKVKVEPGSQIDFLASLHFKCRKWNFELGYNLWARESEDVSLNDSWTSPGTYGLAAANDAYNTNIDVKAGTQAGAVVFDRLVYPQTAATGVSSATTIKTFGAADDKFITENDVDVSGHPSALSHKILAGISYDFDFKDRPWFLAIGGSYEFPDDNAALEQWAIWAKVGLTI
ncbi:hypothetical protein GF322_04125 [Candidatus Dependentiae bacterium]|nr:hypothetical protein [Candidatus Dependentiae bacterium]